jgi:hypothetical protein
MRDTNIECVTPITYECINHQPTNQLANQPARRSTHQPTDQLVEQPINRSIDQAIDELIDQSKTSKPANQPTPQPTDHLIDQSIYQSINLSANHLTNQSINQPTNKPTNLPTTNHSTDLIKWMVCRCAKSGRPKRKPNLSKPQRRSWRLIVPRSLNLNRRTYRAHWNCWRYVN